MLVVILVVFIIYTLILRRILLKNKLQYIYYREIPTKGTPAYVGKIIKGHVDGNDIISTIMDLSHRGYIDIVTEKINGKDKQVLYLQRKNEILNLAEHELFLVNQMFKDSNRVVFDEYIKNSKFKQNFIAFDKILERSIERKRIYKNSLLKNINKITLLTSFSVLGIIIIYSLFLPLVLSIGNILLFDINLNIIINIIISGVIYFLVAYKYISYINKTTNSKESLILSTTYIILSIILCLVVGFSGFDKIFEILTLELIWYKIIINFILSAITLLYMFNIIKHTEKEEFLYYFFIITSIIAIFLNFKLAMGISIIFLATYIFFKSPKHTNLTQEDYVYKWLSFKKYLEDFSLLSEQEENAILIWEKYLIYAVSLGVNKKIIKKYGNINNVFLLNEMYLNKFYNEYFD